MLAPLEEDFLTAATATADAERLRQVRRNRQLRGALVAAITLLAIAFVAGTIAGLNGRRAQSEAARASAEGGPCRRGSGGSRRSPTVRDGGQ